MTTTASSTRRWLPRMLLVLGLATVVALTLAVILVAMPFTRRCLILAMAQWMLGGRLESLAVDLDIQPNLRWMFTFLVMLPVGFGLARMLFARRASSAAVGLALAGGTMLGLAVLVWWQTRHFNFDAKGRPVVYLSFRRDGVHKSYSPGIDRLTGRPKYEARVDRVQWLSALAQQPVRQVNPSVETNWFDANSGEPNLWYVETGANQWQFFNRPHFHQQLRVEVSPITPALMVRWQAEHSRRAAEAELLRLKREAEAKAAAEKQQREERDQAEHRRQADLLIRAEAEALAKLESERRARAEQAARDEQKRREAEVAAEATRRLAQSREPEPSPRAPKGPAAPAPALAKPALGQRLPSLSASVGTRSTTFHSAPPTGATPSWTPRPSPAAVATPRAPSSPSPAQSWSQSGKHYWTPPASPSRTPHATSSPKPSILRPAGAILTLPFKIARSLLTTSGSVTIVRTTPVPAAPPPAPGFWAVPQTTYHYSTWPATTSPPVPPPASNPYVRNVYHY